MFKVANINQDVEIILTDLLPIYVSADLNSC